MRPRAKQLKSISGVDGQVLTVQSDNTSIAPSAASGGGAVTGLRSIDISLTNDIISITPPNTGTISGFDTLDFPDSALTGQRFNFHIPEDYDSGDLSLMVTYRMSTAIASANNQVRIETTAEIAKASDGTLDTASYPAGGTTHVVPDNSLNIVRESFMTITAGDFASGDSIEFLFKRDGSDAADLHTGDLKVITFDVQYTAAVANSSLITTVLLFSDTDESPPTSSTKSSFDTLDFLTGVDNEQKFTFGIPDNWDESSDIHISLLYSMSTAEASKFVRIATEGEIADTVVGTINVTGVVTLEMSAPSTTNITRSGVIRTISSVEINKGDYVTISLARRGANIADTHGGNFQLLGLSVHIGVSPQTGFTAIEVQSLYLEQLDFNSVSALGDVTGSRESPSFGADFETYALMTSDISTGRIDVSFQGRMSEAQSSISSIAIPIKGTAGSQYQLKVYVEGQGASVVYDSTLLAASTSRTVTTLTSGNLSNQPTGEKRFFVVIEATLDSSEELRVGNPFVKMI